MNPVILYILILTFCLICITYFVIFHYNLLSINKNITNLSNIIKDFYDSKDGTLSKEKQEKLKKDIMNIVKEHNEEVRKIVFGKHKKFVENNYNLTPYDTLELEKDEEILDDVEDDIPDMNDDELSDYIDDMPEQLSDNIKRDYLKSAIFYNLDSNNIRKWKNCLALENYDVVDENLINLVNSYTINKKGHNYKGRCYYGDVLMDENLEEVEE